MHDDVFFDFDKNFGVPIIDGVWLLCAEIPSLAWEPHIYTLCSPLVHQNAPLKSEISQTMFFLFPYE